MEKWKKNQNYKIENYDLIIMQTNEVEIRIFKDDIQMTCL